MVKLSERQQMIMSFIEDFIEENDYPPTIRDIQNGCSISSTSVVAYNLDKLKEGGQLNRHSEVSRGLSLASVGPNSNKFKPTEIDSIQESFFKFQNIIELIGNNDIQSAQLKLNRE